MSEQQQSPEQEQEQATVAAEEQGAETQVDQAMPGHEEAIGLLEDARTKADEHWNLYLRTQAEMENLKKRAERDIQNAHKFGLEKFMNELLPVIDSLEMGLQALNREDESLAGVVEGMDLTLKMFSDAVSKFGLTTVDPQGEVFNPEFHQAMSMQAVVDAEPNTVIAVMQKGYLLNDRLVRPAMVVVATAP